MDTRAVRPSAILTNLILRNLRIFIGCPFLRRGHHLGRRPMAPAVSFTVGVRSGRGLTSSRRKYQSAVGGTRASRAHGAGSRSQGVATALAPSVTRAGTHARSSAA